MKKLSISMIAVAMSLAAFAAANDALIKFSSKGPDKYADGATVLDGEYYALCWSKDFSQFAINADGTASGGAIVLKASLAKGGRCPTVMFEVNAGDIATKYAGGTFAVYMLDTRKYSKGAVAGLAGSASVVNASGSVGSTIKVGAASLATFPGSGDVKAVAATASALPADVPQPQITGIKVADGYVQVTVKGTVPFLAYGLSQGDTPGSFDAVEGVAESGATGVDDEITLMTPAKEGGAFFKVGRK